MLFICLMTNTLLTLHGYVQAHVETSRLYQRMYGQNYHSSGVSYRGRPPCHDTMEETENRRTIISTGVYHLVIEHMEVGTITRSSSLTLIMAYRAVVEWRTTSRNLDLFPIKRRKSKNVDFSQQVAQIISMLHCRGADFLALISEIGRPWPQAPPVKGQGKIPLSLFLSLSTKGGVGVGKGGVGRGGRVGGGGVGVVGLVVVMVWGGWWWGVEGWWVVWLDYLSNQIPILKNCHFGVKENHCWLNEGLEIWTPKHFSFVGKGQT